MAKPQISGRKQVYNRLTDAIIYLLTGLLILDANSIDVGRTLSSVLALCGASSLVVGLALKEPVMEIVQGTSILVSDKFRPGDTIKLSDGTQGQVEDMRWTDTKLRASDNTAVSVPHTQMAKNRIINFSRLSKSQVAQKLVLPNRGTKKISTLLDDIKKEIHDNCPELLENESSVYWTDIEKNDIKIDVECHFTIPRLGKKYWNNRQNVLKAVTTAVEKYNS